MIGVKPGAHALYCVALTMSRQPTPWTKLHLVFEQSSLYLWQAYLLCAWHVKLVVYMGWHVRVYTCKQHLYVDEACGP